MPISIAEMVETDEWLAEQGRRRRAARRPQRRHMERAAAAAYYAACGSGPNEPGWDAIRRSRRDDFRRIARAAVEEYLERVEEESR